MAHFEGPTISFYTAAQDMAAGASVTTDSNQVDITIPDKVLIVAEATGEAGSNEQVVFTFIATCGNLDWPSEDEFTFQVAVALNGTTKATKRVIFDTEGVYSKIKCCKIENKSAGAVTGAQVKLCYKFGQN